MPSAHLAIKEEDVVKLCLEFLQNRSLHIAQLCLERETGIINGCHSDDALFLRQLILDGQWEDVLEFVQPLEDIEAFDAKKFRYIVLKYKYFELLCIKAEAPNPNNETAVQELVKVLEELEKYAPNKEAHNQLCLYLTVPRFHEHADFRDWNPSGARVQCWSQVFPLVEKFLPAERKRGLAGQGEGIGMARNDRLLQLMIKGLLYESCVDFCQNQATGEESSSPTASLKFPSILATTAFSDSDLSLLSWLQSIPPDTFGCPFEQKTLNVDVERLEKPSLEASWTEHLLVTPIKPKTFPHSAIPYNRLKATDIMSRSLNPNLDGLPFGLGSNRNSMIISSGDINMMSKSIASFHLTGKKTMNTSVDRLFDTENVFTSSSYGDLPPISEKAIPVVKNQPLRNRSISPDKRQSTDSLNKPALLEKSEKETREEKPSSPPSLPIKSNTPTHTAHGTPTHQLNNSSRQLLDPANHQVNNSSSNLSQNVSNHLNHHLNSLPNNQQQSSLLSYPKQGVQPHIPTDTKSLINPHMPIMQLNHHLHQHSPSPSINVLPANQIGHPIYNNNISKGNDESSELFNIYQRRQQQQQQHIMIHQPYPQMAGLHQARMYEQFNNNHINSALGQHPTLDVNRVSTTNLPGAQNEMYGGQHNLTQLSSVKDGEGKPRFLAVTRLEDIQAVRCSEFHPSGQFYAVGSNSKTLRICAYPKLNDLREDHSTYQPNVLFKRTKHHKGSIYCMGWSPDGDLIATGSNDKTIKLMRFNPDSCTIEGQEVELTMHDGTVRDITFLEDTSNKSSLLISGGAGDCKIYVTDCVTGTPFQALSGHTGHILALHAWGGAMFVSGSQDRTIRFWDLRTRGCVNVITPGATATKPGGPVASVCVDPSGRLLVSGHEDSVCTLYDIRGNRIIQTFRPHSSDVRSIRFSPSAYYLLTAGYDNKLILTDLQGDLTLPLPSVVVAEHTDKVISARWHPMDFSFISASADKCCTLWALPPV